MEDESAYAEILEHPLNRLSATNGFGEDVSAENFWLSGKSGAAGSFSSGAGKKVLISRIKRDLPKMGQKSFNLKNQE